MILKVLRYERCNDVIISDCLLGTVQFDFLTALDPSNSSYACNHHGLNSDSFQYMTEA